MANSDLSTPPKKTPSGEPKESSFSTGRVGFKKLPSMSSARGQISTRLASNKLTRLILLILICAAAGFGGGWLGSSVRNDSSPVNASTSVRQQYVSSESQLISDIAKNTGQGVVSIDVQSQTNTPTFFGFVPSAQESAGTGFIISSDGIIVTNRHVVPSGTSSVSVTLSDGTLYNNVQVIGRTSSTSSVDVAFLKITDLKGKKLVPVTLGDSSKVQVGDKVVAIGNALGQFQNTVTSGIISGYGRDVTAADQSAASSENLTDLFQTDASINEGNSGGPLVNINNEVIGINTAVASGAQNIGFAIPINAVKGLISSILGGGQLQQPFLGVRYVSLTPDIATQNSLSVQNGAFLVSDGNQPAIEPGSPAERAGLRAGDIITKINNSSIDSKTSLTSALSQFKVGDKVTLSVVRDGKTISIQATLSNTPQD